MRWSDAARGVLALLALLTLPLPAPAQSLVVEGEVDHPAADLLREIVARGDYRLLDRDTVLPAGTDLAADVVVLDARVALEGGGTIRGAVAVVHGSLFLRPGARVAGPLAEIAGDVFVSGTAATGGLLTLPAVVGSEVALEAAGYRLVLSPPARPPLLVLPRLAGATIPTYDRVNGLTVGWGTALNLGRDTTGSRVWATGLYHVERRDWGGEAGVELPLGRSLLWLTLTAARGSVTNEGWIRGDLVNSAASFVFRSDVRDYYHAERATLVLARRPSRPLVAGEGFLGPRLGVLLSRDRSLDAGDPWTLLDRGEPWRPNPPVSEATIVSALAGASLAWRGATLDFAGDVALEWAPPSPGDREFALLSAEGVWGMAALWGHSISVRARTRIPLGPHPAPGQRRSSVGGPGTLPTLETAALRGDHLLFVESRYVIPFRRISLPLAGSPALRLQHSLGSAWDSGAATPRWEQNLAAGVEFSAVDLMIFVNPADEPLRPEVHLGATLPAF